MTKQSWLNCQQQQEITLFPEAYRLTVGKVKVKVFHYKPDVALGVPGS
jgi:hypothetical protein